MAAGPVAFRPRAEPSGARQDRRHKLKDCHRQVDVNCEVSQRGTFLTCSGSRTWSQWTGIQALPPPLAARSHREATATGEDIAVHCQTFDFYFSHKELSKCVLRAEPHAARFVSFRDGGAQHYRCCEQDGLWDNFATIASPSDGVVFLESHGTLVAVSAPLLMPLRDSDIQMNVPYTLRNKQPFPLL